MTVITGPNEQGKAPTSKDPSNPSIQIATMPHLSLLLLLLASLLALAVADSLQEAFITASMPEAPVQLRVEYMRSPSGLDVEKPRFGWELVTAARGQRQARRECCTCLGRVM